MSKVYVQLPRYLLVRTARSSSARLQYSFALCYSSSARFHRAHTLRSTQKNVRIHSSGITKYKPPDDPLARKAPVLPAADGALSQPGSLGKTEQQRGFLSYPCSAGRVSDQPYSASTSGPSVALPALQPTCKQRARPPARPPAPPQVRSPPSQPARARGRSSARPQQQHYLCEAERAVSADAHGGSAPAAAVGRFTGGGGRGRRPPRGGGRRAGSGAGSGGVGRDGAAKGRSGRQARWPARRSGPPTSKHLEGAVRARAV